MQIRLTGAGGANEIQTRMSAKSFRFALSVVLVGIRCLAADASAAPKTSAGSTSALPQIDAVLDRYIEALGGKAALQKITSRVVKGEGESSMLPAPTPWQFLAKAPNKRLSILTIAGFGDVLDGFDGAHGWMKNPTMPIAERGGEELAKIKRDADFYRELRLKTLYPDLAVKRLARVGEEETYVAESKPSPQSLERFYFGRTSGLLLRQDSESGAPGRPVQATAMYFSDFRVMDGVKLPYLVRIEAVNGTDNSPVVFTLRYSEVKQNLPIEDAKFQKPSE